MSNHLEKNQNLPKSNVVKSDVVLKFWFGEDFDTKSFNYKHKPQLWFQLKYETDELIKEKFFDLHKQAADGSLDEWINDTPSGPLALIIVLSQFSRNIYRGQANMFDYDVKAINLATKLIENASLFNSYALIEKYFIYYPLLHSENAAQSLQAVNGIEKLLEEASNTQKESFAKYFKLAKLYYEALAKFGRYPQRNDLLNRRSTINEIEFLTRNKSTFFNPVCQLKKPTHNSPIEQPKIKSTISKNQFQSVLFLHGFRQNSNKLGKRTKKLAKILIEKCNAHITYLNGTHPYRPSNSQSVEKNTKDLFLNSIESQRTWYITSDDRSVYDGIEESIAYVIDHVKRYGPYDGIIGFSQGAILASIIIKLNPNFFKWFISISSSRPCSLKFNHLYAAERPFDFPSLHIYGTDDLLVSPEKSIEFSKCFSGSKLFFHNHGHFNPDVWPNDKITEFVTEHSKYSNAKQIDFDPNFSFELKLARLNEALLRNNLNELNLEKLLFSKWSKDLLPYFLDSKAASTESTYMNILNIFKNNEEDESFENFYDKLLIVYFLMISNKESVKQAENVDEYLDSNLNYGSSLFLDVYLSNKVHKDFLLNRVVDLFFVEQQNWKELIFVCDKCFTKQLNSSDETIKDELNYLYKILIDLFAKQLVEDLKFMDRKNKTFYLQELTKTHEIKSNDAENKIVEIKNEIDVDEKSVVISSGFVSELAKHLPRIKSCIDKRSRVGRELADKLNPFKHIDPLKNSDDLKKAKIHSYNRYRKVLSALNHFNEMHKKMYGYTNPRAYLYLARRDKTIMEQLMLAPLSDAIINPIPEPVDYALSDEMNPLYEWLSSKDKDSSLSIFSETDLKFLKGTVTTDGRLDLCKQVIGPNGVKPLLDSMESNKHVQRLLLGNNIVGDQGAKLIAEFIKSGKSPLLVWYIAGNNITNVGIKHVADALLDDKQVNALWLKRNPLKSDGMIPIANLLRFNQTIQVLDLINCGLLDEGIRILFNEGLAHNNVLKHLYLSANGITPAGLAYIEDYYKNEKSTLETLFLGANRIGNNGAEIVSRFLKNDKKLVRLNLASSRIGSEGMKSLAAVLENHPTLRVLDIGYMKSTIDLGELGNYIEDEGAISLGEVIKKSKIISLNITHNHLSQVGLKYLIELIKNEANSLIYFDYVQYGVPVQEIQVKSLREALSKNKEQLLKLDPNIDSIMIPEHVSQIYSVYRTK